MKKSVLLRTCAAVALPLAATFVAPSAAYAQETSATVQGRVTSNGAPVPNAQVVIVHEPSNTTSRTTSDANGNFSSSGLRVGGPFRVEVSAPNFEGVRVTGVNLSAGEPLDAEGLEAWGLGRQPRARPDRAVVRQRPQGNDHLLRLEALLVAPGRPQSLLALP